MTAKSIIGEERRHQERIKQIDAVNKKARQLFEQIFPNPNKIPSDMDFIKRWDQFTENLMSTFGQKKDFRLAFQHGSNLLKNYQTVHNWPYSRTSHIIVNRPDKQLRTTKWLNKAWALYDAYQTWCSTSGQRPTDSSALRYQSLLLSLIFDSGHLNHQVITAFNLQLQDSETLPLKHFSDYPFVTLRLNSPSLCTNDITNGDNVTTYQCFLSLKTLGQLNLWRKTNKSNWKHPNDSDTILRAITQNFPNQSNLLKWSLPELCSAAAFWFERHSNTNINEALLEYRIGRTHSYSLPTTNLVHLIAPRNNPVSSTSFYHFAANINVNRQKNPPDKTLKSAMPLQNELIRLIKLACKPKVDGNKVSSSRVREKLELILNDYQIEHWQAVFIQWLISKSHSCTTSTVYSYMINQIKYWYLINEDHNLEEINDSTDLEELYFEQISLHSTVKSKRYYALRLKDLHAFASSILALPPINSDLFLEGETQKHVRSGLIDEPLFKALLLHIHTLEDLSSTDKLALQTLCIISYRCGLRINELNKLLIENIEESSTGWISVRPNRFGDNKTASGLRKVPLFPLLLPHEKKIVSNYLRSKRSENIALSAPLLIIGEDHHRPFDRFAVSNYVGKIFKAISGLEHFVFHHLRHSALSRLQIMLECSNPKEILPYFYPYSSEQTIKIKSLLFKKTHCNGYWEIAAFAGHETPKMTFEHYFHLSDLISSQLFEKNKPPLTWPEAKRHGLCTRRLYREIKSNNTEVFYRDCYSYLLKALRSEEIVANHAILSEFSEIEIPAKKLINITICYQTLEAISHGESIEHLSHRYCLEQNEIQNWVDNAQYLASLKTKNSRQTDQRSRLISQQRSHLLVLGKLKNKNELAYLGNIIEKLRVVYREPKHRQDIQRMMEYSLHHTFISKSGITFNDPKLLKQFISTFRFAIQLSHWRARKLYVNNSKIKSSWQDALKGIKSKNEVSGTKTGRPAQGSVRLELISPGETRYTQNQNLAKYSSHLLKYLVFMSFVMLHKNR
jgi:integrase